MDDVDAGLMPPPTGKPSAPMGGRTFDVVCFNDSFDKVPHPSARSLPDLRAWLKGTADSAPDGVPATDDEKKRGAAFSPCRYLPGTTRGKANVAALSCFVVDLDNVDDATVADVFARLAGVTAWAWTTWGSGWAKKPAAWRVVVPLAVDVGAEDWPGVWRLLTERIAPMNDPATKDASRMFLLPRAPLMVPDDDGGQRRNGPVCWREQDGALFDPAPLVVEARATATEAAMAAKSAQQALQAMASTTSAGNRPDAVARARAWADKAESAFQGQNGSGATMRVAGVVVRGFGLDESDAMHALSTWNGRCVPSWSPDDLRRKVREALATADPQGRPRGWLLQEDRQPPATTATATTRDRLAKETGDSMDENAGTDDASDEVKAWQAAMAQARAELELAMGATSSALSAPCDFPSYSDLVRKDIPPTSWLVQGLVTDRAVAVIAGEPKAAKTWLALELGLSVALGEKALGEFTTGAPRGVALFLTEDNEANVRDRLRGTIRGHCAHDDVEPPIHVRSRGALDLSSLDALAWLVASVRRIPSPPALLVIDPLRNVLGPLKENDNTDMAKVNAALRGLRDVLGATVLYVHHTSKTTEGNAGRRPGQRMAGGGALHGGYDAGIHLSGPTEAIDGDVTVRKASVDVEVKAGRGAGRFAVELRIHDDSDGHCVRADWSFHRDGAPQGKGAGADNDDAAILAAFDVPGAASEMPTGTLAGLARGNKARMGEAIGRLIIAGRLSERAGPRGARLVSRPVPPASCPDLPSTHSVELFPLKGGEQQNRSVNPVQNGSEQVGTAEQVAIPTRSDLFRNRPEQVEGGPEDVPWGGFPAGGP